MPVVVNEFEVVPEQAQPAGKPSESAAEGRQPAAAGETERTLRLLAERARRLRAD